MAAGDSILFQSASPTVIWKETSEGSVP